MALAEATTGDFAFEVQVGGGVVRVGVATGGVSLLGTCMDALSAGHGGTGFKSWNGRFSPFGRTFASGHLVTCAVLREEDALAFALNGEALGSALQLSKLGLRDAPLVPALATRGGMATPRYRYHPSVLR